MSSRSIPQPFLRWVGSKRLLVQRIIRRMPPTFRTYHEPFVGGGSLFFYLYRERALRRAILSDINPELIDTYRAVRDHVHDVIDLLASYPYSAEFYYTLRSQDPWSLSLVERAARMIYLNKTCYNGLYRVNRQGRFNVPFGTPSRTRTYDPENLLAASYALQTADILCTSFETVIDRVVPGDWVYFDPPYLPPSTTPSFTDYHTDGFSIDHHLRLRDLVVALRNTGVFVTISNSDTPTVRQLYHGRGYTIDTVVVQRLISSVVARRRPASELIISTVSYACT